MKKILTSYSKVIWSTTLKGFQLIDKYLKTNLYQRYIRSWVKKILKKEGFKVIFSKNKTILQKSKKKIILSHEHTLYLLFLKRLFDRYFKSIVSSKSKGFEILDFSHPQYHTYKKTGLSFFCTSIPEEDWEINDYFKLCPVNKGDIVLDAGAYIGYSAYEFSKKVGPEGKVIALEPDSKSYKALVKNIKEKKLTNVIPVNKGLWSKKTTIKFVNEGSIGSMVVDVGNLAFTDRKKLTKVISLKDLYKDYNLKRIDFAKIDIEGSEIEAIEGSLDFIKNKRINFIIESHGRVCKNRRIMTHNVLKKLFKKIGYKCKVEKVTHEDFSYFLVHAWR